MTPHTNGTKVSEHTGFPNAATDRSLDTLDLHHLVVKNPASTFFMRITGNDWAERGIFDEDVAIIDRALKPRPTDLVIWWEGEAFVISHLSQVILDKPVWGVVIATLHRYHP